MIEEALQRNLFKQDTEKTYIDKLLARREVDRVKELAKKDKLNRSELLELLHMCAGTENKLLNLGTWDRYVMLKFFVWIREFIKITELSFDYRDYLDKQHKEGKIVITDRTNRILDNNERLLEHNAKFLIDLYFNIARTTLSLGGTGFLELLKNKFEMAYPQYNSTGQDTQKKAPTWGYKAK